MQVEVGHAARDPLAETVAIKAKVRQEKLPRGRTAVKQGGRDGCLPAAMLLRHGDIAFTIKGRKWRR